LRDCRWGTASERRKVERMRLQFVSDPEGDFSRGGVAEGEEGAAGDFLILA
jgi:hypothetical protein